jgi:hypothetical protein
MIWEGHKPVRCKINKYNPRLCSDIEMAHFGEPAEIADVEPIPSNKALFTGY